jgi:hypothetical protein
MENQWFYEGRRIALVGVLDDVLTKLGVDSPEKAQSEWVLDKSLLLLSLRVICRDFGDDSYPPDTKPADVVNDYLYPYLQAEVEHSQAMEKLINRAILSYNGLGEPIDQIVRDMKNYMEEFKKIGDK